MTESREGGGIVSLMFTEREVLDRQPLDDAG